jgi:hypothetical protein
MSILNKGLEVTRIDAPADEGWQPQDPESLCAAAPSECMAYDPENPRGWTWHPLNSSLQGDTGCKPAENQPIPMGCLHFHTFEMSNAIEAKNAEIAQGDAQTRKAVDSYCQPTDQCVAVLMGIHLMVRRPDADMLGNANESPWIFMTFWWTGEDNRSGLPAPWKYFQMNVTKTARIDDARVGMKNICYNPYLEGTNSNGAVSNCVSCHRFAAYNHAHPDLPTLSTGVDACHGGKPIPEPSCKNAEADYWDGLVSTERVWSLASPPIKASK